jgi:hypothetical protein
VGIGAAARHEKGISSTQLVREVKLGLRDPDTVDTRAIIVNYSEMNKSLDKLKAGLITRFNNVYEAFVFMDRGGDWMITCNEFKMQSKSLKINIDPRDMELCLKRLGMQHSHIIANPVDLELCPKQFDLHHLASYIDIYIPWMLSSA